MIYLCFLFLFWSETFICFKNKMEAVYFCWANDWYYVIVLLLFSLRVIKLHLIVIGGLESLFLQLCVNHFSLGNWFLRIPNHQHQFGLCKSVWASNGYITIFHTTWTRKWATEWEGWTFTSQLRLSHWVRQLFGGYNRRISENTEMVFVLPRKSFES